MPRESLNSVVKYLHRMIGFVAAGEATDAELLTRFAGQRDAAAFELLVWRHGPMVLGLSRRLLRHEQDAEDVFQATFLTMVRKAGSIAKKHALASWLYKVAYRIACRLRMKVPQLTNHPAELDDIPGPEIEPNFFQRDLRTMLDREVARLPERYRRVILLCHVQGKTQEEAARTLGCPKGTVAARLVRARERLRLRLTQQGLAYSTSAFSTVIAEETLAQAVSAELVQSTVRMSLTFASGTAASIVSAKAAALAVGALQMMWLSKVKMMTCVFLALILAGTGIGLAVRHAWAGPGSDDAPAARAGAQQQISKADPEAAETGDGKAEIPALRAEIAKLRKELDAAIGEIRTLQAFLAESAAMPGKTPLYQGKPVAFWLEQFKDGDPEYRAKAATALGALAQKNKDLIRVLAAGLTDRDASVAQNAACGLDNVGPDAVPFVIEVLKAKKSNSAIIHAAEALRLAGVRAAGKPAVPYLAEALKIDDWQLRSKVLSALGAIGKEAKPAIPAIVGVLGATLKSTDAKLRDEGRKPHEISMALIAIDPAVAEVLPKEVLERLIPDRKRWEEVYDALKKKYLDEN
ncbi:MAG: sigma-70 family RNA polymerase sigma factor [Planctomycetes bacterium]|nr:sigma-70 family RNA polymerase sigma factor [Planctomycetota bacterium]